MPIDPTTLDDPGLKNLIENYRKRGTSDNIYLESLAEYSKRKRRGLDFDTTTKVLLEAASESRFVSYGELAKASGADWNQVHYAIGGHLDDLIEYCHRKSIPLLSAIVVIKPNVKTGKMEPDSLKGFIKGVRGVGIPVTDDESFMREEQKKVFEWAKSRRL